MKIKIIPSYNSNIEKKVFNNTFIIDKINENKINKNKQIIEELNKIYPLDYNILLDIYNKSISIHQCCININGNFLENDIVEKELLANNILYKRNVTINKNGIIVGINKKKNKCFHIVDFVIGDNIENGKSITNYSVISCKTTCRERWTQDDWTFTYIPKKYILLTISNDYPSSNRFRESEIRKIITCCPKINDNRKYKLNYDNLVSEII